MSPRAKGLAMTDKLGVVLLFGGQSNEHSISCVTARGVLQALDRNRYRVVAIGITVEGTCVLEDTDPQKFVLDREELPHVVDNGSRIRWPESTKSRELKVQHPNGELSSLGDIDIVFPILHGPFGEDGTIQGMLELYGLPYVGSGVLASAVGMDKHFTKTILQNSGIIVAPWHVVTPRIWDEKPETVYTALENMGFPVFVKPSRSGSSLGVTKVTTREELPQALEDAFAQDSKVLIESAIVGRELEIGVLGGRDGGAPRTSVAGEIIVNGGGFYDFEAKYLGAEGIELVCPAVVTDNELAEMSALAVRAFEAVDGRGLARVDFFLTETGFIINEINTMPGFTPFSMFPSVWLASGMSYTELIDELIDLGLNH
jgi:D-alanine-D-alanine ligase